MVNLGELDHSSLPTGTLIPVDQLPQMEIIRLQGDLNRANYQINRLEQRLEKLTNVVSDIGKDKIVQFKENDVNEVNKRIERLEAKVALTNSIFLDNPVIRFFLGKNEWLKKPWSSRKSFTR